MFTDKKTSVVDEAALSEIVTFVWQTLVGTDAEPAATSAPIDDPRIATISIGGPWTAALVVTVSAELARSYAATLLGLEVAELETDDVADALGELANVVGGNVKGMLDDDGASTLTLPIVSPSTPSITGGQLTVSCTFDIEGQPMSWELYERP